MKLTLIPVLLIATFAKADSIAYEIASSRDFGTVDLNTGAYTEIAKTPNLPVIGLGELGGTLYTVSYYGGAKLYSVNTVTANFTAIGNGLGPSINFGLFGSTTTGLYAIGNSAAKGVLLYSIDPITGLATPIGPTVPNAIAAGTSSLSNGANTLYLTVGSLLYTIDTASGSYTVVGNSLPFDASTFENGSLYGALDSPCCSFYTINTSTAQATFVSTQTSGPPGGVVDALAPVAGPQTTPEPASILELLLGLGSLLALRQWRKLS